MKKEPITKIISKRLFYVVLLLMTILYVVAFLMKETPSSVILFTPLLGMTRHDWKAISTDSIQYLLLSLALILSYPIMMLVIGIGKPTTHYYSLSIYFLAILYILYLNRKKS